MSNEATEKFIEEGFKRYKEASKVMVYFGELLESKLKSILENRNEWSNFIKKEARAKSTMYWSKYPLLNAKLKGKLKDKDKDIEITIGINWYQSELDYPFYSLWMKHSPPNLEEKFKRFEWGSNCKYYYRTGDNCSQLAYIPKPEDFNLERDFNILLDEFNRFLNVL